MSVPVVICLVAQLVTVGVQFGGHLTVNLPPTEKENPFENYESGDGVEQEETYGERTEPNFTLFTISFRLGE